MAISLNEREAIVRIVSAFAAEATVCWEQQAVDHGTVYNPATTLARIDSAVNAIVATLGGLEPTVDRPYASIVPLPG